jgi:hypothetical protein
MVVQRAHEFQPGQYTKNTVEAAAMNLRVEMAANQHGLGIRIGSCPFGEDIAHRVDPDRQARLLAPVNELVTHRRILVGKRQPLQAALFGRADFGGTHQRRPKA